MRNKEFKSLNIFRYEDGGVIIMSISPLRKFTYGWSSNKVNNVTKGLIAVYEKQNQGMDVFGSLFFARRRN